MTPDGTIILEGVYQIMNQDDELVTDLECCYQILGYLTKCLAEEK